MATLDTRYPYAYIYNQINLFWIDHQGQQVLCDRVEKLTYEQASHVQFILMWYYEEGTLKNLTLDTLSFIMNESQKINITNDSEPVQ